MYFQITLLWLSVCTLWDTARGSECYYSSSVTEEATTIRLPRWTRKERARLICTWTLEAETKESRIQLKFTFVPLSPADYITITDGSNEKTWHAKNYRDVEYNSISSRVQVKASVQNPLTVFELEFRSTKSDNSGDKDGSRSGTMARCPVGFHIHNDMIEYDLNELKDQQCEEGQTCFVMKNFKMDPGGYILTKAICVPTLLCSSTSCSDVVTWYPGDSRKIDISKCSTSCCAEKSSCQAAMTIKKDENLKCKRDKSKVDSGRRCKKSCTSNRDCRGNRKKCVCDGWCGYSCINPDFRCEMPRPQPSMTISYHGKGNRKIRYDCLDGYYLVGEKYRSCHSDKSWSGREPSCRPGCKAPEGKFENSIIMSTKRGYAFGEEINLICEYGYLLVGTPVMRCLKNYRWSQPQHHCVRNPCGSPPIIGLNSISKEPPMLVISHDGVLQAHYNCADGFSKKSKEAYSYCRDEIGQWSQLRLVCEKDKKCKIIYANLGPKVEIESLEDGTKEFSTGEIVDLLCYGSSVKSIECLENGQWSDDYTADYCKDAIVRCPHIPSTDIRQVKYWGVGRVVGTPASIKCTLFSQTFWLLCKQSGEWDPKPPSCTISCSFSTIPTSLKVIDPVLPRDSFPAGTVVKFECKNTRMKLWGRSSITCTGKDTWDGEFPSCGCHEFQNRPSELFISMNKKRTYAEFRCEEGFELQGFGFSSCINGQWSNPLPSCIDLGCELQTHLLEVNVRVKGRQGSSLRFKTGETAQLTCFGEKLAEITCGKKGLWSPSFTGFQCEEPERRQGGRTTPKAPTSKPSTAETRPTRIDHSMCGNAGNVNGIDQLMLAKVVGGAPAARGAWPWQTLVLSKQRTAQGTLDNVLGGASIINDRWLLTASHLFNENTKNWKKSFVFGMGLTEIATVDDLDGDEQFYEAADIILYENFNILNMANDIALVKIGKRMRIVGSVFVLGQNEDKIAFSESVRPVCIPCLTSCASGTDLSAVKYDAKACRLEGKKYKYGETDFRRFSPSVVTGFGHTEERLPTDFKIVTSTSLQQGRLEVKIAANCRDSMDKMRKTWIQVPPYVAGTFCAKGYQRSRTDSCQGDSGGPVVRKVRTESSSCWYQIGIVSWGLGCSAIVNDVQYPAFYTDVAYFAKWILETIKKES